jgi:hypothetical protein
MPERKRPRDSAGPLQRNTPPSGDGSKEATRCGLRSVNGAPAEADSRNDEKARPLWGPGSLSRRSRGGAGKSRAGHLNGCPTNRFQIAKKKPSGANQPGFSRLAALTREAAPRWSKNTGWSN